MKEYDFVIIGGGCAGLSLAYELDFIINLMIKNLRLLKLEKNIKEIKPGHFGKLMNLIILMIVLKKLEAV